MVDAEKLERKIASLIMTDCSTRHKKSWARFMKMRYRVEQYKIKNPEKFNTSLNVILTELDKIERAANSIY